MPFARLAARPMLFGMLLFAGCGPAEESTVDDSSGDTLASAPADTAAPVVGSLQSIVQITCPEPAVSPPVSLEVGPQQGGLLEFSGARKHSLWVWRIPGPQRTITMTELTGTDIGVEITASGPPIPNMGKWAVLHLDANDCPAAHAPGSAIVRLVQNGTPVEMESRVDQNAKRVLAALDGNSSYIIATPVPFDSTGAGGGAP